MVQEGHNKAAGVAPILLQLLPLIILAWFSLLSYAFFLFAQQNLLILSLTKKSNENRSLLSKMEFFVLLIDLFQAISIHHLIWNLMVACRDWILGRDESSLRCLSRVKSGTLSHSSQAIAEYVQIFWNRVSAWDFKRSQGSNVYWTFRSLCWLSNLISRLMRESPEKLEMKNTSLARATETTGFTNRYICIIARGVLWLFAPSLFILSIT